MTVPLIIPFIDYALKVVLGRLSWKLFKGLYKLLRKQNIDLRDFAYDVFKKSVKDQKKLFRENFAENWWIDDLTDFVEEENVFEVEDKQLVDFMNKSDRLTLINSFHRNLEKYLDKKIVFTENNKIFLESVLDDFIQNLIPKLFEHKFAIKLALQFLIKQSAGNYQEIEIIKRSIKSVEKLIDYYLPIISETSNQMLKVIKDHDLKLDRKMDITLDNTYNTLKYEKEIFEILKKWGQYFKISSLKDISFEYLAKESEFFIVDSINKFSDLTKDLRGFLEIPFKDEKEWQSKTKELFYFGEDLILKKENLLKELETGNIFFITGKPNVGKTTFLLYFLDDYFRKKYFKLIIFLNPLIQSEELEDKLNQIQLFIKENYEEYTPEDIVIAIDGLRRNESEENYINKCDTLFEWINYYRYKLLISLQSAQTKYLKTNFQNVEKWKIDKWSKYRINEIHLKPNQQFSFVKNLIIRHLDCIYYKGKIQVDFSFDDKMFNECIELIIERSKGIIGDIVFILNNIADNFETFTKNIINKYPIGSVNLRWHIINREYYIRGDDTLPLIILLLTKQRYPLSKEFIDEIAIWRADSSQNKKEILSRVENLWNSYTISSNKEFEGKEERILSEIWKQTIEKGLTEVISKDFEDLIHEFKTLDLDTVLKEFFKYITNKWNKNDLNYSHSWFILADLAKIWGIDTISMDLKLCAIRFAVDCYEMADQMLKGTKGGNFLRKTLLLLVYRAIEDIPIEDYSAIITFYKGVAELDNTDYRACWILGEFYEKKLEPLNALTWYIRSVDIEKTSRGYSNLIYKIKRISKKFDIQGQERIWHLDLQWKAAIKAIEHDPFDRRNWSDLAKAEYDKGRILLESKSYNIENIIKHYSIAVNAYKRALELTEFYSPREDLIWFYKSQIVAILEESAIIKARFGVINDAIDDIKENLLLIQKSLEDFKKYPRKIDQWLLSDVKRLYADSMALLYKYTRRSVYRIVVIPIFEYLLEITCLLLINGDRRKQSDLWYQIYFELERIDKDFDWQDIDDLKISALVQSIKRNKDNIKSKNIFNRLSDKSINEIKRQGLYDWRYHGKRSRSSRGFIKISEVIHQLYSAVLRIFDLYNWIIQYNPQPEEIKSSKYKVSLYWSNVGKKIQKKFIDIIPRRIAIDCFNISVYIKPDNVASLYSNASENLYDYNYRKALIAFNKILRIERKIGLKRYSHLAKIGVGMIRKNQGKALLALKNFNEGIDLIIEILKKDNPEKTVISLIKSAQNIKSLRFQANQEELLLYLNNALKTYEKALELLHQIISIEKPKLIHFPLNKEIELLKLDIEWMKQMRLFPLIRLNEIFEMPLYKIILLFEDNIDGRINKAMDYGTHLLESKRYKESLECYEEILKIKPNSIKALNYKGQILGRLGRFEESLNLFNNAIYLINQNPNEANNVLISSVYSNKGYFLNEYRECEEAVENLIKAINYNPKSFSAWHNIFYASLFSTYKKAFRQGLTSPDFNQTKYYFKNAIIELKNANKFKSVIDKLILSIFKSLIFEFDDISDNETLKLIMNDFNNSFVEIGLKAPTLNDIEDFCRKSSKFNKYKDKVEKVF